MTNNTNPTYWTAQISEAERDSCIFLGVAASASLPRPARTRYSTVIYDHINDDRCHQNRRQHHQPVQGRDDFNVFNEEFKFMFQSRCSQDKQEQHVARLECGFHESRDEGIELLVVENTPDDGDESLLRMSQSLDGLNASSYREGQTSTQFNKILGNYKQEIRPLSTPIDNTIHETSRAMQLRHEKRRLEKRGRVLHAAKNLECESSLMYNHERPTQRSRALRQRKRDLECRFSSNYVLSYHNLSSTTF